LIGWSVWRLEQGEDPVDLCTQRCEFFCQIGIRWVRDRFQIEAFGGISGIRIFAENVRVRTPELREDLSEILPERQRAFVRIFESLVLPQRIAEEGGHCWLWEASGVTVTSLLPFL
jgi:hypothetical protein